jgi:biopolymer transport protein ExbD
VYDPRPDKIIFIKGDSAVKFQDVIMAMDIARGAGVKVIGVPPKPEEPGAPAAAAAPAAGQ